MSDVTNSQSGQPGSHFHTLGYMIESGEAERIAVDFVARGAGNATAVTTAAAQAKPVQGGEPMTSTKKRTAEKETKTSGKHKDEKEEIDINSLLSLDEAEMIASLTAKANAVRMLQSRIELMKDYIEEFEGPKSAMEERNPEILRSISALLARLPLVVPTSTDANGETTTEGFDKEQLAEKNDVELVSLLAKMTESLAETKELGKKYATLNGQKRGNKGELDMAGLGAATDYGGPRGGLFGMR